MNHYNLLKQTFKALKIEFTSEPTLIGYTVTLYPELRQVHFEFDTEGKFQRIITI